MDEIREKIREKYEQQLESMCYIDQVEELKRLFLNMMDWMQQEEACDIYMKLYATLGKLELTE